MRTAGIPYSSRYSSKSSGKNHIWLAGKRYLEELSGGGETGFRLPKEYSEHVVTH
jgi:hypothetical protein